MLIVGCAEISSEESFLISPESSAVSEPSSDERSDDVSIEVSEFISTPVSVEDSKQSSEIISSATDSEPSSEEASSSETLREPGIYLQRSRIGVAVGQTVPIPHEVYPLHLGKVAWELVPDPRYNSENQAASVTPSGEVTGIYFNGTKELQIKGILFEFEVFVTLMVYFDYDEYVDTFYPSSDITDAIDYGDRYHNGTTMYARQSRAYPTHYYAYNLKAGMTFNVMGLTRYKSDRSKFYFEFGYAVGKKFVTLEHPFISSDGNALLLGYEILKDGEYMVRVKAHIEINTSADEFSYIKYTFWF